VESKNPRSRRPGIKLRNENDLDRYAFEKGDLGLLRLRPGPELQHCAQYERGSKIWGGPAIWILGNPLINTFRRLEELENPALNQYLEHTVQNFYIINS
jgi:hypothetical protein